MTGNASDSGRILGVDWGERRVGFAVSDPLGMVATPMTIVEVRSAKEAVSETLRVAGETEASKIVIGLPINMDGTRGPIADKVEAFSRSLLNRANIPVVLWDERLTTAQADRVLSETNTKSPRRKAVRDKLAAQIMLQSYLDAQAPPPLPEL